MGSRIQPFVLVVTLAMCLVQAANPPIEGTWEGSRDGVKAATLTVRQTGGILGGSVIFYIIRDNGDGSQNGQALPEQPISAVEWDGRTLRFSVVRPDGVAIPFEMRVTGQGRAELRRRGSTDPDEIVPMLLRKSGTGRNPAPAAIP